MESEELLKKRFRELARKSYQNNQYTFTDFLGMAELACFYEIETELSYISHEMWGGSDLSERMIVRFGSEEELGYGEDFPIACLLVKPLAEKFADNLTHRDFLGALMNLGIERSTLGDIVPAGMGAYIFCVETMADYIMENLCKVKHTPVLCKRAEQVPVISESGRQEIRIQVPSMRIDAVLAKIYRLSRGDAAALFRQKKVFVNGRLCENNSLTMKSGDIVSVRGYGKFEYLKEEGVSKKGKINADVLCYGKK